MLKIGITDDHTLFRKSLGLLIGDFKDMEVTLEAAHGQELLEKLEHTSIDILLLDLQMPVMDGFETAQKVKEKHPEIKILILTLMNDVDTVAKVLQLDVHGFFTKNTPPNELQQAIFNLKEDGFHIEQGVQHLMIEATTNPRFKLSIASTTPEFTETEFNVIEYTAQGLKAKEIAEKLKISARTVEVHKHNILKKNGFDSMMTVMAYCYHNKIIKTGDILSKIRKNTD